MYDIFDDKNAGMRTVNRKQILSYDIYLYVIYQRDIYKHHPWDSHQ